MKKILDFKIKKYKNKEVLKEKHNYYYLCLLFFILNISIISCGEEINSQYKEVILPQLKITQMTSSEEKIDITSMLEIKFNTKVLRASLYKGISCQSGNKKATMYLYLYNYDDGDLVKILPYYPLIPYVKYICKITQEVTDLYGAALDKVYEFSFKTSANYYSNRTFNPKSYAYNNVYNFLQRRCSDCHSENHKLNFKKEKRELYDYLTLNKNEESNKFYITPNDTENSYIMNKLMGIDFFGDKMPINQTIALHELEKIIGWIRSGAEYEEN